MLTALDDLRHAETSKVPAVILGGVAVSYDRGTPVVFLNLLNLFLKYVSMLTALDDLRDAETSKVSSGSLAETLNPKTPQPRDS